MSNESKSRAVPEENKMGVMPVGRLLFSMSLPMMLSMLVQALYPRKVELTPDDK